jgi:histidyl-tRNA synthetase
VINSTQLLFTNFGDNEIKYCLSIIAASRNAGIKTELYPDNAKMKKQMSYANAKNILYVAIVGDNEMTEQKITLKNMQTGEQKLVSQEEMIQIVKDAF